MTKMTKKNGSAMKIMRCVRSVVVDISTVDASCDPTYITIRTARTQPVARSVRSGMKKNCASPPGPHGFGFGTPGGLTSGQMSCRRSLRSM